VGRKLNERGNAAGVERRSDGCRAEDTDPAAGTPLPGGLTSTPKPTAHPRLLELCWQDLVSDMVAHNVCRHGGLAQPNTYGCEQLRLFYSALEEHQPPQKLGVGHCPSQTTTEGDCICTAVPSCVIFMCTHTKSFQKMRNTYSICITATSYKSASADQTVIAT